MRKALHQLALLCLLNVAMVPFATVNADIAYLAPAQNYWQVFLYDERIGESRQVTSSPYDKSMISWFPLGQELLINAGSGALFKLDIETQKETAIEHSLPATFYDAVLSPDGKKISFSFSASGEADDGAIWVLDLQTQRSQKLTNMAGLQHSPAWGADGEQVYFISNSYGAENGLWKVQVSEQKVTQLTTTSARNFDLHPFVEVNNVSQPISDSYEDEQFLFSSNLKGTYDIWIKRKGSAVKLFTSEVSQENTPIYDPEHRRVCYVSAGKEITTKLFCRPFAGGSNQVLVDNQIGIRALKKRPSVAQ